MSMSLRWRFLTVIWAVGIFFAGTVSFTYYTAFSNYYLAGVDAKLTTGAQMARHFVGADFHDRIADSHSLESELRFRNLLDKWGPQYSDQAAKIRATLKAEDLTETRRLAHGLKGVAATLGAQAVAAAALAVEQPLNTALRNNPPLTDLEPLLEALNQSLVRLLQAIESTRNA